MNTESSSSGVLGIPRRQAARAARSNFAEQLDTDTESGSDAHSSLNGGSDAEGTKGKRKARAGNATKTRKRAATGDASTQPSSSSVPSGSNAILAGPVTGEANHPLPSPPPRPRLRPVAKKASAPALAPLVVPHSHPDLDDLSDLTPLSAEQSALSESAEFFKLSAPATAGSPSKFVLPPSSQGKASGAASASHPPRAAKEAKKRWTAVSLGTYVWVLVTYGTWRVYGADCDEDEDEVEYLWWPGRITSGKSTDIPLKVKLFGAASPTVSIRAPSERSILSRDENYITRFSVPTYVPAVPLLRAGSSRTRERDRELVVDKWQAAVDAMRAHQDAAIQLDDSDSDGLPELSHNMWEFLTASSSNLKSISAPAPSKSGPSKGLERTLSISNKRKRPTVSDADTDDDRKDYAAKKKDGKGEEWWDEVDDSLNLPGELVLGRTAQSVDIDHWPGKLIAYMAPTKPKTFGKYSLMWLDGTQGAIPRSWFYTMEQDEYALCKLGQFDSAVVEVQNDQDDDDDDTTRAERAQQFARREPSPTPLDTPPPGDKFAQLSIREQFVYTKGVLRAILKDEYAPLDERQRRYMRGGKHRQSIVDGASLRGKMDPREVTDLLAFIREWCLRDRDRTGTVNGSESDTGWDWGGASEAIKVGKGPEEEDAELQPSSPSRTVDFLSSPPQMPPSSFPSSALEREDSLISILSDGEEEREARSRALTASISGFIEHGGGASSDERNKMGADSSSGSRQRGSREYESLGRLEKVDYCLNILLPEAIRQILLWRNGNRTSVALLSPAEEQDLYDEGTALMEETDWVNDVIRYRNTLQKVLSRGKVPDALKKGLSGRGTRSLRNIVKPNYQE